MEFVIGVFSYVECPSFDPNSLRQNFVYIYQSVLAEIG